MTPTQEKYRRRRLAFAEFIKLYPFTPEDLDGEEWRPIDGYDGYQISSFGRVKSLKFKQPHIMKPIINTRNYLTIHFRVKNKIYTRTIHRLVAKAFLPNPDNKPQVNHIDGCKINNAVSNLEWVTNAENMQHAFNTGLNHSCENKPQSKLTAEQVLYIRENPDTLSQGELAKKFHVGHTTINDIQTGKKWKRVGGKIYSPKPRPQRVSDADRAEIKRRYKRNVYGHGTLALAKKFGIAQVTVRKILNEK